MKATHATRRTAVLVLGLLVAGSVAVASETSSPTHDIVDTAVAAGSFNTLVAAVQAAAQGAPRAVVVVLSENPRDASRYRPEDVRRYLQWLRVPLFVWTTGTTPKPEWGNTHTIGGTRELRRAEKALFDELEHQWIVWLEGNHMINEVELADTSTRFRLAGS